MMREGISIKAEDQEYSLHQHIITDCGKSDTGSFKRIIVSFVCSAGHSWIK